MYQHDPREQLAEAERLLDRGEPEHAIQLLLPLTSLTDAELASAAWITLGRARFLADDEPGALAAWQQATGMETSRTWLAWRSAAEQHVRDGNLDEAIGAYREADRRAPREERGAIANRIAWLLKETGHDFAARRQFNRARGAYATYTPIVTWSLIALNVAIFFIDWAMAGGGQLGIGGGGGPLVGAFLIYGPDVAAGEWWRIITSAFVHLGLAHIAFNMIALYLFGPLLEQMYGHLEYLAIYLLCAAGGSVLTLLLAFDQPAAGASGAIFGLFGLAFVVSRRHHVAMTRQARAVLGQAGTLLLINLVLTFTIRNISWTGHLGGLVVGAVLGFLLAPAAVPTIQTMFHGPSGAPVRGALSAVGRMAVYAIVTAGLAIGTLVAIARVG